MVRTRFVGGGIMLHCPVNWEDAGYRKNRIIGSGALWNNGKSAVPTGYNHPSAWLMAIRSGGIATDVGVNGTGTLTINLAGGKNATITLAGSGDLTAIGQLIVSAVATLSGVGTLTTNVNAVLNAVVSLLGSGTLTATPSAIGHQSITLNATGALDVDVNAIAEVICEILPFTELSPESLATAVWSSPRTSGDADTMGEALRLAHAILRNRTVTDPVAGTFTVYADDDTTVLLTGDLWQDAAGTTPYAGAGAERRDQLT